MKRKKEQEKKSRCIELLKELFDLEQTNEKTHKQAKERKTFRKKVRELCTRNKILL